VKMFDVGNTRTIGQKLSQYVKPFSSNTRTLRTDRQTDGRTELLLYQYRASLCADGR